MVAAFSVVEEMAEFVEELDGVAHRVVSMLDLKVQGARGGESPGELIHGKIDGLPIGLEREG